MRFLAWFAAPLGGVVAIIAMTCASIAQAQPMNACQKRELEQCRLEQSSKPDSARGGQTVTQYCTNMMLMRCAGTSQ
jgi:hypothetical protein